MSEFLAPINYDRAQDVLRRLSLYTAYTPGEAQTALATLRQCYPLVFTKMEEKRFENDAVLLEFPGANVTGPLVFTAHLDVDRPGDAAAHTLPMSVPLSRAHLVTLLEALEELLRDGYCPVGDLMLALSMDGLSDGAGARSIASHLKARKVNPCFILDYGGYATMDAFRTYLPKDAPLALIGVAEKGELRGEAQAGNDGRVGAVERIARAAARLSRHEKRASLCPATTELLHTLAKKAPAPQCWLARHPRLSLPLMRLWWRKRSVMNQFFVSERRLTRLQAQNGDARLAFRQTLVPGRDLERCMRRLRLAAGPGTALSFPVRQLPTPMSERRGEAWDALATAIEIQFERAVIAPCLCPFVTDARHYAAVSDRIYRFSPFLVTGREALSGLCTVTEGTLQTAVQFFRSMLSV